MLFKSKRAISRKLEKLSNTCKSDSVFDVIRIVFDVNKYRISNIGSIVFCRLSECRVVICTKATSAMRNPEESFELVRKRKSVAHV